MRTSILILIITLLLPCKNLFSQTTITPHTGASIHSLNVEPSWFYSYLDYTNEIANTIGIHVEQNIFSKFSVRVGGFANIQKHSYRVFTRGINPGWTIDYNLANINVSVGYELIDRLELGAGINAMMRYNRFLDGVISGQNDLENLNNISYLFYLQYDFDKFNINASYTRAPKTIIDWAENPGVNLLSLSLGYRINVGNYREKGI